MFLSLFLFFLPFFFSTSRPLHSPRARRCLDFLLRAPHHPSSCAVPPGPPPQCASPPLPVRGAASPHPPCAVAEPAVAASHLLLLARASLWPPRMRRRCAPHPHPPRAATAVVRDLPSSSLARSDEGLPPPFDGIRPSVRVGSRRRRRDPGGIWAPSSSGRTPTPPGPSPLRPDPGVEEGSDAPPLASSRRLPATAGLAPPPWAPLRLLLPIRPRATSPLFFPTRERLVVGRGTRGLLAWRSLADGRTSVRSGGHGVVQERGVRGSVPRCSVSSGIPVLEDAVPNASADSRTSS